MTIEQKDCLAWVYETLKAGKEKAEREIGKVAKEVEATNGIDTTGFAYFGISKMDGACPMANLSCMMHNILNATESDFLDFERRIDGVIKKAIESYKKNKSEMENALSSAENRIKELERQLEEFKQSQS